LAILPTLILSSDHIVTDKDFKLKGRALWQNSQNVRYDEIDMAYDELKELNRYNKSFDNLFYKYTEGFLYLHPVKLS